MKVIMCDDHALFRLGVRAMLANQKDIEMAGDADSGKQLFLMLRHTPADVVLLDLIMPEMSGAEIARRLRAEYPDIKILVISSEDSQNVLSDLLETGIDGFISKQNGGYGDELANAIRSVYEGQRYFGRDISSIMYRIYISVKQKHQITDEFTPREREIIELCRDGLLTKEIADKLNISPRTVDAHRTNIFQKLGINSMKEVLKYCVEHGIV